MTVSKAIIPAAGLGTRLFPATKAQPKEMLIVGRKPIIHYVVEEAIEAGIEDILIITGKHKRAIEDYFDSYHSKDYLKNKNKTDRLKAVEEIEKLNCNIHYKRQMEPKGLGHAVLQGKAFVNDESFAVLLGDSFFYPDVDCLGQMIDIHNENDGANVIAGEKISEERIPHHGILDAEKIDDKIYNVRDAVEKPSPEDAPSNIGIGPRYILSSKVFEVLSSIDPGKGGEIQLTDAIADLIKKHRQKTLAYLYPQKRYHISDHGSYQKTFIEILKMSEGPQ